MTKKWTYVKATHLFYAVQWIVIFESLPAERQGKLIFVTFHQHSEKDE